MISLNYRDSRPIYEQIKDGLKKLIVSGAMAADEKLPEELKAVLSRWAPELSVLLKTPANAAKLSAIAPFTGDMQPQNGKAAYYICKDGSCSLPVVY